MVARLIERGLMYGDLVRVEGVLVERYRRALRHLTGRDTALADFHVDISGYSPEIGDELGDDRYLNHPGFNRLFILVDLAQKAAPLLNAEFSTSRSVLRRFIEANEAALFALTARDAVAGELVNSVYAADVPARLLDIRRVTIEADTTEGTVRTAETLAALIARFKAEPEGWCDEALIARMIELAGRTGDLARNPVRLEAMTFEQEDYWTSHFGGVYVFRGVPHPGVVTVRDKAALGPLPGIEAIELADRTGVARFLAANGLVEPLVTGRGPEVAALLRQKMDFVVADAAGGAGLLREGMARRDLGALARRLAGRLPPEWEGLAALADWAGEGARWPRITSDHPAYFYTLRATPGEDADLVNRLLAELTPLDVRQLFLCHKELFYRLYRTWPEAKKAVVADLLATEYLVDKAGTRAALFGPEPPMAEAAAAGPSGVGPWGVGRGAGTVGGGRAADDLVDRVGPWGALQGRR